MNDKKRFVIINVIEICDSDDIPYVYRTILETSASKKDIMGFLLKAKKLKNLFDEGIEKNEFNEKIPEYWEDTGWHEKVEYVLKTVATKTNIGIIIDSDALGVDIS